MEDEEIMCLALCKATGLDSISILDFKTLTNFFNITPNANFQEGIIELKKSISYIILTERNDLQEYFNLSKFRRLPPYLCHQIITYFRELWELFKTQKIAMQKSTLKEFQKSKTPMEKISKSLAQMKAGDQRDTSHLNFSYFPPFGTNTPDFSAQPIPSYMFPYQNYMGGTSINSNIGSIFQQHNARGGMVDNLIIQSEPIQQQPQVHFKQEQISQKEAEHEDNSDLCYCGDSKDSTCIKCRECDRQCHFKCWQAQVTSDAVCPSCRLTQHNYTKLVNKAVFQRCNRVDQQISSVKKINLTSQEQKRLSEYIDLIESSGRCWMQMRVLRINPSGDQNSSKGFRTCFPLSIVETKKMLSRKWIEIKFKNIVKGQIVFFVLACVTVKDLTQISNALSTASHLKPNNFVKEFMQVRAIQHYRLHLIHPIKKQKIVFPVRGPRCMHIQCQELSFIYEQGIKKEGKIACSYCKEKYSTSAGDQFRHDPMILKLLQSSKEEYAELTFSSLSSQQSSFGSQKMQQQENLR